MKLENQTIDDGRVIDLDSTELANCVLKRCTLRYSGGPQFKINGCQFFMDQCHWEFAGAASNTLRILAKLYAAGGGPTIELTFDQIRGRKAVGGLLH